MRHAIFIFIVVSAINVSWFKRYYINKFRTHFLEPNAIRQLW